MKTVAIFLLAASQSAFSMAQNVFPSSGNVGIGTSAPAFPLDVKGYTHSNIFLADAVTPGDANFIARGPATGNANIIAQGGAGNYTAFWITGANGLFKIGGNGGTEPAAGVVNITWDGKVGIGTASPGSFMLAVEGALGARSVKVTLANPWPDFVFYKGYKLSTLVEVESYIKKNNHLPGIPSQQEVARNGVDIGEMNAKLLEKVEELTLYLIELKKENARMKIRLNKLIARNTGKLTARDKR